MDVTHNNPTHRRIRHSACVYTSPGVLIIRYATGLGVKISKSDGLFWTTDALAPAPDGGAHWFPKGIDNSVFFTEVDLSRAAVVAPYLPLTVRSAYDPYLQYMLSTGGTGDLNYKSVRLSSESMVEVGGRRHIIRSFYSLPRPESPASPCCFGSCVHAHSSVKALRLCCFAPKDLR